MNWRLATSTTTALLHAMADPANRDVWEALDNRYRPVIKSFAMRLGLQEPDADDVAQQTLAEFFKGFSEGRYQRGKGRLSSWLIGIGHNTVRASQRRRAGAASSAPQAPEPEDMARVTAVWTQEQNRVIVEEALRRLHASPKTAERTIRAFEMVVLRGVPAQAAAEACGMSVDEVYVAKSRLSSKLRALVEEITAAFENDG